MTKKRAWTIFRIIVPTILSLFLLTILLEHTSFLTLFTGICIFLFAMTLLQESFKILSGGILDQFLDKVANTNFKSFIFAFVLTTFVQSSGLVSVIAISFLSASLITLSSGVAMIYGVNLSTALSAWIMSFFGVKSQISLYAMPLIVFGVLFFINKHKKVKGLGLFLLSLGFLFLGISYMKEGFENFKESIDISQFQMQGFLGLIVYVLIGFFITTLTQSSHATLTLAIVALNAGEISYENSIAIVIGANVGSTIMTVIGSLNSNIEGKKLTATHVFFNIAVALLAIVFFKYYLWMTEVGAELVGIASDDLVLKLSLFATIFNIIGVVIFYPFISQMCTFLNKIIKVNPRKSHIEQPVYLTESALEFSDSALEVLYLESKHLFKNTTNLVSRAISLNSGDIYTEENVDELISRRNRPIEMNFDEEYQNKFKGIYSNILEFAVDASALSDDSEISAEFMDLRRANLFMATAIKSAQTLQINIIKYAFSTNEVIKNEYDGIRKNLLRTLRLAQALIEAQDNEGVKELIEELNYNVKKYDSISSSSLDSHIRYNRITDTIASSIMNDMALAKSIANDLTHSSEILVYHMNDKLGDSSQKLIDEEIHKD
ncbi:Na/Pi cotransporter family protein [Campylobacter sp. LR291e]|nr:MULTISPECIES: Na/Pi symporter [unclassified Campylobacter]KAA6224901.1 Na/Pi cotransporter family protein [Campylobacter sp. LR185c]KAA6226806.1 Na/Pi cotransporter family protein [Campylobacter sp. LR196d]KAA6230243.1 Na/Pi cotransporter family protein [Campylobacter sp. LR291e]KAA6233764.1 Na/Pi cotransporter family protein [Campylobacter sp. LR264d]KAA8604222.1 sodium:phosphate symporter [Campylobacter sp. LR185c]